MTRISSFSERPGHHRPRRLADWLNPTGARKVHSLVTYVSDSFPQPASMTCLCESRMRENCMSGLCGGRGPALRHAPPTRHRRRRSRRPVEGRDPALVVPEYGGKREGMVARPNNPIEKVRELQRRLYIAAKRNEERRFHALYDRIWRSDVLLEAWTTRAWQQGCCRHRRRHAVDDRAARRGGVPCGNCKPRSVKGSIGRSRCGVDTFPNQTAGSGRWAFRRCEIAWCRWRRRSS